MPSSTYFKPDVEVLQEFRNVNPVVLRATLQSVIVGPSYQKIKNSLDVNSTEAKIGAYSKSEIDLDFPALSPDAVVLTDSLGVVIKNYAGDHTIVKTVMRTEGNSGVLSAPAGVFTLTDNNQDFVILGVKASANVSDHDGDFVHVLSGAASGYFEVQTVTQHTLTLDDPEGVLAAAGGLSGLHYDVGSFGWMQVTGNLGTPKIRLTPRLSDSGIVYLSGTARRQDYTQRMVVAESVTDLEQTFNEPISIANPLGFGMSKNLLSLGANEITLGLMVEDDTTISYQKAFEFLESEDVYCIVPLTTNPIVHQMLSEHVKAMSAVEQKMERIGLFNTVRHNRVVKSGYLGRQDPVTKAWDLADGNVKATGVALPDTSQFGHQTFLADGSGVEQVEVIPAGYTRLAVYFRAKMDYTLSYALNSAPATDIPITLNNDGVFTLLAPTGQTFANVKFTSAVVHANKCEIFYAQTQDPIANSKYYFPVIMNSGTQMDNPYLNPTAGHQAIKVRVFDYTNPVSDPLVGTMPDGLTMRVSYGNGAHLDVTSMGTHSFDGEIDNIYVFNATGVSNADNFLVEVLVLEDAGTYRINELEDPEGTFLSNKAIGQEDELVIIDKTVADATTFSKFKETRYRIGSVPTETQILIDKVFDEGTGDFITGEFPGVSNGVYYRVETPIVTNKYQLATWYRDISKSFANRRMSHIYAPAVGVSDDGVTITPVPGYYFACAYAGATQSELPQNGFTNRPFAGFMRVFFTNDYFTEAQMNIIAEGGTTIVIQSRALAMLSVRHQLTTDMTSIETREYSVTKDVDYMAKSARASFRPYIGRYLINETTLNILYSLGNSLIQRWLRDGNITGGSVDKFVVDPTQADKVIACFILKVPLPLNYIRLIFVI
jgi:hypothetical protein